MANERDDKIKKAKERMYNTKWDDLKRRGFTPPRDAIENKRRLDEAHDSG